MTKRKNNHPIRILLIVISLCFSIVCGAVLRWYETVFNVSIEEIMFTIQGPLAGADSHFLQDAVIYCLPAFIILLLLSAILIILNHCRNDSKIESHPTKYRIITAILSFITVSSVSAVLFTLIEADRVLQISSYLISKFDKTTIYEDYYVEPEISAIRSDNPRNLIYIILESMETTYASDEVGGKQKKDNYIPHLTALAEENISFSNTNNLGGFRSLTGSTWTMGSIFSTESGIPFAFPIDGNSMDTMDRFASGATTLGDILHEKGYYQEFLCGSDGEFAGRKKFFEQHGYDQVYDLYSAIDDGYVKKSNDWWGLEDRQLYKIAENELNRLSTSDKPFNLTMLTVDTHHVDGWVCKYCKDKYPEQLANVVTCADNQVFNFIEWCKQQPWYENTTIIIQGDHPRMDNSLVDGINPLDRTIYNCFINSPYERDDLNLKCREFAAFDMFPSILSSIGYTIPSGRLGLGTDLFSSEKTLSEALGYSELDSELKKSSDFYKKFY